MLVYQANPVSVQLFSYVNTFFCSNKFVWLLDTWVRTLCISPECVVQALEYCRGGLHVKETLQMISEYGRFLWHRLLFLPEWMILHAKTLIVQRGKNFTSVLDEDWRNFNTLITQEKNIERELKYRNVAADTVNGRVFPRTARWISQLAEWATTESCVKIETHKDNRSDFLKKFIIPRF